jgi:D-inositol-3-phosphate glycosyltransferase
LGEYAQENWRIPHIATFHTLAAVKNDTEDVEKEPELRVENEKQLAKTCQRIIASTEKEKELLIRYYEASPNTIRVVPCGVNLDLFRPLDKLTSRQQLDFHQNETVLLYVGRFVPSKGLDRLLEAMSHLRKNHPVRMMIIGGENQQSLDAQTFKKLSQEFGVQDQVTFVGRIEQEVLPAYYNAADILVVPSRYESFGLVALESLACGTPVLATRVGAMETILQEGKTGYLVDNGSPSALAEGIETFISSSHTLSGDAIRASVLKYDWENVTSALIKEYETVLLKQGGPM